MTRAGGWEGKEKLQKPLGDVYPSHLHLPALPFEPKNPRAARELCLEPLRDLLGSGILWESSAFPLGYEEQQMASQALCRAGFFRCGCLILCLMLPGDFTYRS